MFPNQGSQKQTLFTGTTTYDDNHFIGLFAEGVNFKISKADFLGSLGVSGTLEQVGEAGATQILNTAGTVHQIRSVIVSAGVTVTLSPLGSVEIGLDLEYLKTIFVEI